MLKTRIIQLLSVAAFLLITQTKVVAAEEIVEVDLQTLTAKPDVYSGKIVRTCGWAHNKFEDVKLTVTRDPPRYGGPDWPPPGIGVDWLNNSPTTYYSGPEWRCVTGKFEPLCPRHDVIPEDVRPEDSVRVECLSTGHPYRWVITQQRSLRDD